MFMRSIFSSLLPKKDSAISQLLKKKKIKNFVHFRRPRTKPDNSSYVLFGWISDWLWIYKSEQVFVILIYIQVNKSKVGTNFNLTHNYAFLFTGYTSHNNTNSRGGGRQPDNLDIILYLKQSCGIYWSVRHWSVCVCVQ